MIEEEMVRIQKIIISYTFNPVSIRLKMVFFLERALEIPQVVY